MHNDIQSVLSGMLADWHHHCQRTGGKAGYPGRAAGFGQCRSSSQYDWSNGVEDEMVDKRIMEGFHQATERVRQIGQPAEGFNPNALGLIWHTALQFEARNLAVRHQVWSSPRLPADRQEREVLVLEARVRLLRELARDGVLC